MHNAIVVFFGGIQSGRFRFQRWARGAALIAATISLTATEARADPNASLLSTAPSEPSAPMPSPLDRFGADLLESFSGTNLIWYSGALVATWVMAFGGIDHAVRVGVQRELYSPILADTALYAGYVVPGAIGAGLYVGGLSAGDPDMTGAGSAVLQALGITVATTGLLKFAAGRPYPLHGADPNAPDRLLHPEYAREFHPFQTLWPLPSWPSGHASTMVCVAATLTAYYPDAIWVSLVGYSVAAIVGFGMVDGDNHWASDVVAGGLLGQAIGYTVGRAFRRHVRRAKDAMQTGPTIVPAITPNQVGFAGAW